ncbi:hypothetical protein V1290_005491 [Bradyrhizobium sp. AZCC 1578]
MTAAQNVKDDAGSGSCGCSAEKATSAPAEPNKSSCCGGSHGHSDHHGRHDHAANHGTMVADPVWKDGGTNS